MTKKTAVFQTLYFFEKAHENEINGVSHRKINTRAGAKRARRFAKTRAGWGFVLARFAVAFIEKVARDEREARHLHRRKRSAKCL